jgi:hypothetical protein
MYPSFTLYLLALGAMSIATGVITNAYMLAVLTNIDMPTKGSSATTPDGVKGSNLPGVK